MDKKASHEVLHGWLIPFFDLLAEGLAGGVGNHSGSTG